MIPLIHLWKEVSTRILPQAFDEYPGRTERHSRDGFCKTAAMGTYASYSIVYRPGSKLATADCLSRLPMSQSVPTPPVPGDTTMRRLRNSQ